MNIFLQVRYLLTRCGSALQPANTCDRTAWKRRRECRFSHNRRHGREDNVGINRCNPPSAVVVVCYASLTVSIQYYQRQSCGGIRSLLSPSQYSAAFHSICASACRSSTAERQARLPRRRRQLYSTVVEVHSAEGNWLQVLTVPRVKAVMCHRRENSDSLKLYLNSAHETKKPSSNFSSIRVAISIFP